MDFLEGDRNGLESDKLLCQWVRGQHIAEDICQHFSMDDPSAEVDSLDVKLQYIITAFELQLDRWQLQMARLPQKRKQARGTPILWTDLMYHKYSSTPKPFQHNKPLPS
jgi:hypothetical protein